MGRRNLLWLLTAAAAGLFGGLWIFRRKGPLPSREEVNETLTELAIAIQQGQPLLHAIERSANKAINSRLKKAWEDVLKIVSQGRSLSRAMSAHRDVFPNDLIIAVQQGEQQGNLDIVLLRYASQ